MSAGRVDQTSVANVLRDHRARIRALEATPPPSSGGGIQFDVDNVGDWLLIEATGYVALAYSQPNAASVDTPTSYSSALLATNGLALTDDPQNFSNNGQAVLNIEHTIFTGGYGGQGIDVIVEDSTSAGSGQVLGVAVLTRSDSSQESIAVSAGAEGASSADNVGIAAFAENTGTGREVALKAGTNGNQSGAKSLAILATDHTGAAIFEVRDDGSVHIKTGTLVIPDL